MPSLPTDHPPSDTVRDWSILRRGLFPFLSFQGQRVIDCPPLSSSISKSYTLPCGPPENLRLSGLSGSGTAIRLDQRDTPACSSILMDSLQVVPDSSCHPKTLTALLPADLACPHLEADLLFCGSNVHLPPRPLSFSPIPANFV